jgi:hypothetical protein
MGVNLSSGTCTKSILLLRLSRNDAFLDEWFSVLSAVVPPMFS